MFGNRILDERRSKYNGHLKVVKNVFGKPYIQANGLTQSGGIVEDIWKQTFRQIPHSAFQIRRVLILGLGGGTVAKVIHKYYPNAKITGVDIDPEIVELGKKYLGLTGVDIKIADARKFPIAKYDLVVVDGYVGEKYVDFLSKDLKKSKVVIFNRIYLKNNRFDVDDFKTKLEKIFDRVEVFKPSVNLMFVCYKL